MRDRIRDPRATNSTGNKDGDFVLIARPRRVVNGGGRRKKREKKGASRPSTTICDVWTMSNSLAQADFRQRRKKCSFPLLRKPFDNAGFHDKRDKRDKIGLLAKVLAIYS
jgi:hypothetical protein